MWVDHGDPQWLTRGRSQSCSAGQVGVRLSGPAPCTVGGRLGPSYSTSADQRHDFDDAFSPLCGWRRNPTHRRAFGEAGRSVQIPGDTSEGTRARSRLLTQHGMGRAVSCRGSSAPHHIQPMAHANSRALSRHLPWAGDKGLGRNGIPKPAGAGGGSSSLSLEPLEGLTRFIHLEMTLRLRPERCSRLPFSLQSGAC